MMETFANRTEALEAFHRQAIRPGLADYDYSVLPSVWNRAPGPFKVEVQDTDEQSTGGDVGVVLRDGDDVILKTRGVTVQR